MMGENGEESDWAQAAEERKTSADAAAAAAVGRESSDAPGEHDAEAQCAASPQSAEGEAAAPRAGVLGWLDAIVSARAAQRERSVSALVQKFEEAAAPEQHEEPRASSGVALMLDEFVCAVMASQRSLEQSNDRERAALLQKERRCERAWQRA